MTGNPTCSNTQSVTQMGLSEVTLPGLVWRDAVLRSGQLQVYPSAEWSPGSVRPTSRPTSFVQRSLSGRGLHLRWNESDDKLRWVTNEVETVELVSSMTGSLAPCSQKLVPGSNWLGLPWAHPSHAI